MAPEAGCGALKNGVAGPIVDGAPLGTVFDIKARGTAHVKRHHMVVAVPAKRAAERGARLNTPVITTSYFIYIVDLEHEVDTLRGHGHFEKPEAVMSAVAVHEPQPFYGFLGIGRESDFHQVRQPKPQYLGKEGRHIVKLRRREYNMTHALIAGDEA